jgi:hypothetical protein
LRLVTTLGVSGAELDGLNLTNNTVSHQPQRAMREVFTGYRSSSSVGRNKLAQFRQDSTKSEPELRKLVPAYNYFAADS